MWICPRCNQEASAGSKTCHSCGAILRKCRMTSLRHPCANQWGLIRRKLQPPPIS